VGRAILRECPLDDPMNGTAKTSCANLASEFRRAEALFGEAPTVEGDDTRMTTT